MMPVLSRCVVLFCLAVAGVGGEDRRASDSQNTSALTWRACQRCHSTREMQRGPLLEGLPAIYLKSQLLKFKTGVRGRNPQNRSEYLMGSMRDMIPESVALDRLVNYISTRQPRPHIATLRGDTRRGKAVYQGCRHCHTPNSDIPVLTQLEPWYVLDQLRKYKQGLRGGHADDRNGKLMQRILAPLSDSDLKSVAIYIQHQKRTPAAP
ncbi:hypothetical protein C2W62_28780 [Candidatus Entotheonella serta]|nr:hypothetical protein C2W62_28780 [Candidatus Entotheonella serta]